jgi:hypothetical protein
MGPEAAADNYIEQPEKKGKGHPITEIYMDQDSHTVFGDQKGQSGRDFFDSRHSKLYAGNH